MLNVQQDNNIKIGVDNSCARRYTETTHIDDKQFKLKNCHKNEKKKKKKTGLNQTT